MSKHRTYKKVKRKSTYISKGTGSKVVNTGYGSVALQRKRKNMSVKKKDNLQNETEKLVKRANARLDSLQRRFKKGSWASRKLMNRLDNQQLKMWNKKTGKIKMKKNLNKTQMIALNKATRNFLNSQTSTRKGIEEVRKKQIENIRERRKIEDDVDLSYEEAEEFYEMFGNDDFEYFAEKSNSSTVQACIEDAIDEDDSEGYFIKRLERYTSVNMNDLDIREKAVRLYNKYVL